MAVNQNILPTESMIAGTNKSIMFYLYTDASTQIDATGMTARFAITDFVNENDTPNLSKSCSIITPEGEQLAIITANLERNDTLDLDGKYIYQITINDHGTILALRGIIDIGNNFDKSSI